MRHSSYILLLGSAMITAVIALPPRARAQKDKTASPEQIAFFEKRIRPVLVNQCYRCHAKEAKKLRGNLLLDTRAGMLKGGDTGPAIVPGSVRRSLLIKAIRHVNDDLKMPPSKKLSDDVIADFEKWISMGAPDPREGAAKIVKREIDIEKGRNYWAFQPPKQPKPPAVKDKNWPKSDIDRFILAGLEAKELKPVAGADPRTLLRRIYFDLIGLPPSPEVVESFVKASAESPKALEAVVDNLLCSPQFGERWGRHWLDIARYAESSGRAVNIAYPHAWRYRDYVVDAFTNDKPYDQFIREQIAGDLLPVKNKKHEAETMVATGFLAIGPKSHDERNRRQFQMDLVDEQIDVTFQAFQALTAACARCHDHKFDPIPQKDYYALAGIFSSTETCYGTIRIIQSNHPSALLELPKNAKVPMPLGKLTAERRTSIEEQITSQRERMSEISGDNAFIQRIFMQSRISQMQSQLSLYESDGTPRPLAMGVREGRFGSDARILNRGELDQPGDRVARGFPQVLTERQPRIFRGSGRRELADWIASKDNPLTARVMANRIWLHLIGRGIVPTVDNFGASGLPPSHPELLDYLANRFVDQGWSVKALIRDVIMSRTYQMSSQHNAENYEVDPDNALVWRIPQRRLEAEALRDSMLQIAGQLDLERPVGSPMAQRGEGGANQGFRGRGRRPGGPAQGENHRSVYLPVVRDQLPEFYTLFDFPDPSLIIGERPATTIPAQALYLMNNSFVIQQASSMADNLLRSGGDDAAKLKRAYLLCYSRPPSKKEIANAEGFMDVYGINHDRRSTWAALCQGLFSGVEFSHR